MEYIVESIAGHVGSVRISYGKYAKEKKDRSHERHELRPKILHFGTLDPKNPLEAQTAIALILKAKPEPALMSIGEASLFYSLLYSWYGMSTVASWSDALLYSSGYWMESMGTKPCSFVMVHFAAWDAASTVGVHRWRSVTLRAPNSQWNQTCPSSQRPS